MTKIDKDTLKKQSYTVPCSRQFRDAAIKLAQLKKCNVADLARSVTLMVPLSSIENYPDPGGPARNDRETVILKSGTSEGKPWRRKPRLQVRMASGFAVETIRKALALVLAIEDGQMTIDVRSQQDQIEDSQKKTDQETLLRDADAALRKTHEDHEHLQNLVKSLYFEPLPGGVTTYDQALYVLGFAPESDPDARDVRQRFRRLATVYHPDGKNGCHQRMSQLNAAMELLR